MAESATIFTTPLFRVSYCNLDVPSKMKDSPGIAKYGVTGLFKAAEFTPADIERWKKIRGGVVQAMRDKFAAKAFGSDNKLLPGYKIPFHDGMEKPDTDGYGQGVTFFRMANKNQPGMAKLGAGGVKIKVGADGFYSGCYARASISFWGYDNNSKGVAVNLHNILFIGDGERFGNQGPAVENDFTDLSEDEIGFNDPLAAGADDELAF